MKINGIDLQAGINQTNASNKNKTVSGTSFLEMMKLRSMQGMAQIGEVAGTQEETASIPAMAGLDSISAIAAKARIQYTPTQNDVSEFLELIKTQPHLLDGMDLSGITDSANGEGLTSDIIESLKSKFDVHNITPEDQLELFSKLAETGVLSKTDIDQLKLSVSANNGDLMEYLASETGFKNIADISGNDLVAKLEAMINNEKFTYQHVLDRYGQKTTSVKELADVHQKTADVLTQLI